MRTDGFNLPLSRTLMGLQRVVVVMVLDAKGRHVSNVEEKK